MQYPSFRTNWFAIASIALLGCRPHEVAMIDGGEQLNATLSVSQAQLAVGDTLVLDLRVSGVSGVAQGHVRWQSADPAIARLDTTVGAGERVVLRAVASGLTTSSYVATVGRQAVSGSLPVTVITR
jgi:uncharacterized protein YjdB